MPPTEFRAWYRGTFGEDFPFDPSPLVQTAPLVWVDPALAQAPLAPPVTPAFRDAPGDYQLLGVWGHGVQSHALYCIERRGPHRAFLRLPWGGAYGERDRDARRVLETLTRYAAFRLRRADALSSSEVVSNMGDEQATVVRRDGRTRTIRGPAALRPAPPFWHALQAVLDEP